MTVMTGTYDEKRGRWITLPTLKPCWKGQEPIRNLTGRTFQNQLYCAVHKTYINPDGATCEACRSGHWPPYENIRRRLATLFGPSGERTLTDSVIKMAENIIVPAVERGHITEQEALALVEEFKLDGEPGTAGQDSGRGG